MQNDFDTSSFVACPLGAIWFFCIFPIFNHLMFLQRESALPRFRLIGIPIPKRSWLVEVSQIKSVCSKFKNDPESSFLWASHHDELLLWVRLRDQVGQWQSCSLPFASLSKSFSFLSFPWLSLSLNSLSLESRVVSHGHAKGCFVSSLIVYSSQPLGALAIAALSIGITLPEVRLVAHTCRLDEVSHWLGNAEKKESKTTKQVYVVYACLLWSYKWSSL